MEVDVMTLAWKDKETKLLNRVTDLSSVKDQELVWYEVIDSVDEQHCMSVDMFILKHEPCGIIR